MAPEIDKSDNLRMEQGTPQLREAALELPGGTVTLLFADIEGSTALLRTLGSSYADALRDFRRLFRAKIQEQGGCEVDTQGDTFFAAFTRARDSVAAAVSIQREIHNREWPQSVEVRVRMGLHTGEPERAETGYVGIDVHRAARICGAARGGQILLSQTTRELVGGELPDGLTLQDLGRHGLKDLPRPEWLFQLHARDLPSRFAPLGHGPRPVATAAASPPFLGRQRELEQLLAVFEDALAGRGGLCLIGGEPGAGKSRLAEELARRAAERGAEVLWGRCWEAGGAPPYWPWVQALRSYLTRARDTDHLRAELGAGAADIAEVVPDVRDRLPGLGLPPALEPEQARFRLFDSIATLLKRAAERRALVVVVENLHWADKPSLLLLEFLEQQLDESRLLVVATFRDDELSPRHPLAHTLGALTRQHVFRISPGGLGEEDVARFLGLAAGEAVSPELVALVHARTQGNPLFVTELVRLLGEEGSLAPGKIPQTVREVIDRRLERLSEHCRGVLSAASIVGREFSLELLGLVVDDTSPETLLDALDEAVAARIVEELPGDRYQFTHALVQETIADDLPRARRMRLHAQIAEALEDLHRAELEAHSGELAHHFAEAAALLGNEQLVHYSLLAGERALVTHAYEEALAHFERALRAADGAGADGRRAALLFGLGRAQAALGEREEALASLSRAFDYYADAGDTGAAVAVASCSIPHLPGQLSGAPGLRRRALSLVAPESAQAGQLLSLYAVALGIDEGDYGAAEEAFKQALAIARRRGDAALELEVLTRAVSVDAYHLRPEALGQGLRAIELARRLDDPLSETSSRYYVALSLWASGNLVDAQAHAEAALPLAERLRDRFWLATALWANETIYRMRGDFERAREFSERGLAVLPTDPRLLGTRALLEHEIGDAEAGEAHVQRLLAAMGATEAGPAFEYAFVASVLPLVAHISGEHDKLDEAARAAEAVLASPTVTPLVAIRAKTGSAWIAVLRRDASAAARWYPALEWRRGTMTPGGMFSVDHLLARLADVRGLQAEAVDHFRDAVTFCELSGCRAEYAWVTLDFADWLVRRGERERARELLGQVVKTAEKLGMRPLADRASRVQSEV